MMELFRILDRLVLSLLLMLPITHSWATETENARENPSVSTDLARLDNILAALTDLQSQIDKSSFDVNTTLDAHGYDAKEIIEFVKKQIAFEQYPGVLRGAKGTLMSRSGNSLDQSLLLATLLKDAGYDTRITNTTLDNAGAEELLKEMLRPRLAAAHIGNKQALSNSLEKLAKAAGLDVDAVKSFISDALTNPRIEASNLYIISERVAADIHRQLDQAGILLTEKSSNSELIAEASDYYWVQYKGGAADTWKDIHPAFFDEPMFNSTFKTVFTEEIPAELQHRVRFESNVEILRGGHLEVHPVFKPFERPAANLVDVPLSYSNLPDGLTSIESATDPKESLAHSNFFIPLFNGSLAPGGKFFDVNGHLLDPSDASSPYAALFANEGKKLGSAVSQLGALGESKAENEQALPPEALTAQWIDIVIIKPGGAETRHRRIVFDRLGEAGREAIKAGREAQLRFDNLEVGRRLTMTMQFVVGVGRQSGAYVTDVNLQALQNLRPLMEAQIRARNGENVDELVAEAGKSKQLWTGGPKLLQLSDLGAQTFGDVNYRSAPTVLAFRQEFPWGDNVEALVDIVSNERRVFEISDGQLLKSRLDALRTGVWETRLERVVLPRQVINRTDTFELFKKAAGQGIDFKVLAAGERLSGVSMSRDAEVKVQEDLDRGFAVVLPLKAPSHGRWETAWWRINQDTGVTAGIAGLGEGVEFAEALAIWSVASLGTSICMGVVMARKESSVTWEDWAICAGVATGPVLFPGASAAAATAIGQALFSAAIVAIATGVWITYHG